jgi:nucleoside-diphosphate-sugar epimerase
LLERYVLNYYLLVGILALTNAPSPAGDREVKLKLRNFVDVRDVADALLLVYETPEASGRYICDANARQMSEVVALLKDWYPAYSHAATK